MEVHINPVYAIIAYFSVGFACWRMGKDTPAWWRFFLFAPLTAPVVWIMGLFWLFRKNNGHQ